MSSKTEDLAAIGHIQERLKSIAKILDEREDDWYFKYVTSLVADDRLREYTGLHLSCTNSCIGIRSENALIDLEVSVDKTDPRCSGIDEDELANLADGIRDVRAFIASSEIAPAVRSLCLWITSAANGTAEIALDSYVASDGQFSNLKRFATNLYNEDGECIIKSDDKKHGYYSEAGLLAKLLKKCPVIEELVIPSAPNHEFFSVGVRPLKKLQLKAGFDTQDFILNLSKSDCFPQLEELVYRDCNSNLDDWRDRATPFRHFVKLFKSPAGRSVQSIALADVLLTESQIEQLLSIRSSGVSIRANPRLQKEGF